jgi:transposase
MRRLALTMRARDWLQALAAKLQAVDQRIQQPDTQIQHVFASHEVYQRLAQLEGIGPLTATAVVAAVGAATTVKNGRECAAGLGVVPRQHSTGGKPLLLGISKRGNRYLRKLLIHGARAVGRTVDGKQDRRSCWLQGLLVRRGKNRAGATQANKTACIAWVILAKGKRYCPAA